MPEKMWKNERRGNMRGLCFQLKSTWRDKFCLMTFFLPVVAALALRLAGNIDLSSLGELHFGILEEELPQEAVLWLEQYEIGRASCRERV